MQSFYLGLFIIKRSQMKMNDNKRLMYSGKFVLKKSNYFINLSIIILLIIKVYNKTT